jgi:hypothetical protein
MSDDAKYVDALLANGRLREERDRLREALTEARAFVALADNDYPVSKSWKTVILRQIDAALAKEVGK